jgi:hypothetical protein
MKEQQFPPGWDEERIRQVIAHYENQTEDEQLAEIERARETDRLRGGNMNENDWTQLTIDTIFLSPEIVEGFCSQHGDALVKPSCFRGSCPGNQNGDPVYDEGTKKWYASWGRRPAADAFAVALGLRNGTDLEKLQERVIVQCTNGWTITRTCLLSRADGSEKPSCLPIFPDGINIHHVYECGLANCGTIEKAAARFTNLANLVLMDTQKHRFIQKDGADWLKYIISQLYPRAWWILDDGRSPTQPNGSPGVEKVNIAKAIETEKVLKRLSALREIDAIVRKEPRFQRQEITYSNLEKEIKQKNPYY